MAHCGEKWLIFTRDLPARCNRCSGTWFGLTVRARHVGCLHVGAITRQVELCAPIKDGAISLRFSSAGMVGYCLTRDTRLCSTRAWDDWRVWAAPISSWLR